MRSHIALCILFFSLQVNAATFVVTNTNDSGPGSLRDAIGQSNTLAGSDIINFDPQIFSSPQTIILTSGQIAITAALVINGPGADVLTISGNDASRIFVTGGGVAIVKISDLTLTHGFATDGGAINASSQLILNNMVITGNTAAGAQSTGPGFLSGQGGGVVSTVALTMTNTVISNNIAKGLVLPNGSRTSGVGGGIYVESSPFLLSGCSFTNNLAQGANGDSSFAGGSAYGGAIYSQGGVNIVNSSFDNNSAISGAGVGPPNSAGGWAQGGAIYSSGAIVLNSTFDGNSVVSGERARAYGGAIFDPSLSITNSTVSNNSATGGGGSNGGDARGGGLFLGDSSSDSSFKVFNTTITGNHAVAGLGTQSNGASEGGGTFGMSQSVPPVKFQNNIVADNVASSGSDVFGSYFTPKYNLVGIGDGSTGFTDGVDGNKVGSISSPIDPKLGPLAHNGGVTQTHALLEGSPAIDAGNNVVSNPLVSQALTYDERNFQRIFPAGGTIDMGSYEFGSPQILLSPSSPDLQSGSDTGDSTSDNITLSTAPVFDISNSIPGAKIELLRDNALVASADSSSFTVTLTDLNPPLDASVSYTCRQTIGGGTSLTTAPLTVMFDHTPPTATINQAATQADPTRLTPINFTVVFSEPVGSPGTLSFAGSTANTSSAFRSSTTSDKITYNVAVSGITANGLTVVASLPQGGYKDLAGNQGFSSTSTDNSVTLDNVRPTVTINQATGQADPSTSQPLNLTATFSEPVSGLSAAGISLTGSTANVSQAVITVTGGPSSYNVAISGVTSSGQIRAAVRVNSAQDAVGNLNLGSTSTDNVITLNIPRPSFDFDGDRKSDVSVFRPSDGNWYINRSTSGFAGYQFGTDSDLLTPADFTGDGKTDVAVWRPSEGNWYILRSEDSTFYGAQFGTSGDIPVPGDYDGDGKADQAVFRPSSGTWYLQRSTAGFSATQFGAIGDRPTVGDFDGDGKVDIAVFRPTEGVWYRLNSSNGSFFAAQFGTASDKVVPADYTGDGKTDIAVWRPSDGTWYVLRSEDLSFYGVPFGASSDLPAPGDYDGDGKADATVYRPSEGNWYLLQSTAGFGAQHFGVSEDRPTPGAYAY